MQYILDNIKNNIDFFLRNKFIFSRTNYNEKNEDKSNLFNENSQKNQFKYLSNKYNLKILNEMSIQNYLENLYSLSVLDKYFSTQNKQNLNILDIGSKNWSYAPSEYIFFNNFCSDIQLNGIELDAYRVCRNLYTRLEIAKYHIKNLKNTEYLVSDLLEHNQKYDYIIWYLPFITKYPLVKWGLPLKYFKPLEMLKHAYNLLNDNGELLIINQGEEEYNIQQNLNKQLNAKTEYYGKIDDIFKVFNNERYCSKIVKIT